MDSHLRRLGPLMLLVGLLTTRAAAAENAAAQRSAHGSGVISGMVMDRSGKGIAGVRLTVQEALHPVIRRPSWEVVSDSTGTFEVRGLPEGAIEVRARHPSFTEGRVAVEVDPAQGDAHVRIVLLQGGRIQGRAYRRDGHRAADYVEVQTFSDHLAGQEPIKARIRPDGTFVVEHVPVRAVFVTLVAGSGDQATTLQMRQVQVRDGETVTLDFPVRDIVVSGRVTRSGSAVRGVRVTVALGGDSRVAASSKLTGDDGRYEVIVPEPGEVVCSVEGPGGPYPDYRARIGEAEAQTIDVSLDPVAATGATLEVERPMPTIAGFTVGGQTGHLTLGGRVVTLTGQLLDDVSVVAWPVDPNERRMVYEVTGNDGSFLFQRLAAGRYDLMVWDGPRLLAVHGGAGAGGPEVRIVVPRAGHLVLKVVRPDGTPAAGALVTAVRVAGIETRLGPERMADGQGKLDLVFPPGDVELRVRDGGSSARAILTVGEAEARWGEIRLVPDPSTPTKER